MKKFQHPFVMSALREAIPHSSLRWTSITDIGSVTGSLGDAWPVPKDEKGRTQASL
jgi:hypothetical protein